MSATFAAELALMSAVRASSLLPSDLPPKSRVYRWFSAWRDRGVFEALNHVLLMLDRERSGCPASQSACIIDSQSVKTNEARVATGRRRQRVKANA